LIADYGKRFASLSSEPDGSDATWRTLTTLLNYRVFLNADFSPARFEFMSQRRGPQQTAELEADVIKRTVHFTYPNTIAPGNQTFVYLCALPERAWFFDGFQLRNVIFDGVGIEYKGGPIRLENVYFVNCTFDVQQTSKDSTTKSLSITGTHKGRNSQKRH